MRLLAIETSCDETAVSIIEAEGTLDSTTFRVVGNALYSQVRVHAQYGGVFPSLAKREHSANLVPLFSRALDEAGLLHAAEVRYASEVFEKIRDILAREEMLQSALVPFLRFHEKVAFDAIAVTQGPGLEPALWVGVNFARALSFVWDIPVIPVNHLEGHIISALVERVPDEKDTFALGDIRFPLLALLISGGHTELVHVTDWGKYAIVGRTRDDAAGEAFDKVARLLGLPYPGGPELSRLAHLSRQSRHIVNPKEPTPALHFPRPMLQSGNLDFSFSGLKTAVLYETRKLGELTAHLKGIIAREFEDAVTEVLVAKTRQALTLHPARTLVVGGGVSANSHIRECLARMFEEEQPHDTFHIPEPSLAGDNAVMIGMAAYVRHLKGIPQPLDDEDFLRADGGMRLA